MQDIDDGLGLKRLSLSDSEQPLKSTLCDYTPETRTLLTPMGWAQAVFSLKPIGGIIETAEENTELLSDEFRTGDGLTWVLVVRAKSLNEAQIGVFVRLTSEIQSCASHSCSYTLQVFAVSADHTVTHEVKFSDKSSVSQSNPEFGHTAAVLHSDIKPDDSLVLLVVLRSLSSPMHSRERTGYVGLINEGTTCYLNSLLQTFFFLTDFRHAVYQMAFESDEKDELPLALQRLFYCLQYSSGSVSTSGLLNSFGWGRSERNMQCDVQEFYCTLSNKLELRMKGTAAEGTFSRLFEGVMVNYIKCVDVEFTSTTEEKFLDLQLSVAGVSCLEDSFLRYTEKESLSGENQYDAGVHGKQDAIKGLIFRRLPPVLQLQLKRFQFTDNAMQKINDRFEFPLNLDLSRYMEKEGNYTYTLFSILVHTGDGEKGHYFAFIRPDFSNWIRFDDEKVDKVTQEYAFLSSFGGDYREFERNGSEIRVNMRKNEMSAYMLIYIQTNQAQNIVQKLISDRDISPSIHTRFGEELRSAEKEKAAKRREKEVCEVLFASFEIIKGWNSAGIASNSYAKLTIEKTQTFSALIDTWKVKFGVKYMKMWVFSPGVTAWEFRPVKENGSVETMGSEKNWEEKMKVVYVDCAAEIFVKTQGEEWELAAGRKAEGEETGGCPVFLKWYQEDAQVPLELISVVSLSTSISLNEVRSRFLSLKGLDSVPLNLYIERGASDMRNKHMTCYPPSTNIAIHPLSKASRLVSINPGDVLISEIVSENSSLSAKEYMEKYQSEIRVTAVLHDTNSSLLTTSYGKRFLTEMYRDTKLTLTGRLNWTVREIQEAIASELHVFDSEMSWERIAVFIQGHAGREVVKGSKKYTLRDLICAQNCLYFDLYELPVCEIEGLILAQVLYIDQKHTTTTQIDLYLDPKATIAVLKQTARPKLAAVLSTDRSVIPRNPPIASFLMQPNSRHYICELPDSVKVKEVLSNSKGQIVLRAEAEPDTSLCRVFCYTATHGFFIFLSVSST